MFLMEQNPSLYLVIFKPQAIESKIPVSDPTSHDEVLVVFHNGKPRDYLKKSYSENEILYKKKKGFYTETNSKLKKMRILVVVLMLGVLATASYCAKVTYDHRVLVIDGKRRVLVSGSIHYPCSTPEMWPNLIQKLKDEGLDVIETYVFWNLHEPVRGQVVTFMNWLPCLCMKPRLLQWFSRHSWSESFGTVLCRASDVNRSWWSSTVDSMWIQYGLELGNK